MSRSSSGQDLCPSSRVHGFESRTRFQFLWAMAQLLYLPGVTGSTAVSKTVGLGSIPKGGAMPI